MVCEIERTKSTHKAEVVPFHMEKHPNADALSVVRVFGYTCCVRTTDWENRGIERAVYIPPDSVVDTGRPEFAFLIADAKADGTARVKAKKLRGVNSFGLLIPAPPGAELGTDLAEQLGVSRYEPPTEEERKAGSKLNLGGEAEAGPPIETGPGIYDVEAFQRYAQEVFQHGEPVVVTEKVDGSNCRFVWWDGRMWVKSRKQWVRRTPTYDHITVEVLLERGLSEEKAREIVERVKGKTTQVNSFWALMERTPGLEKFCRDHPGTTVYGEMFGNVNRIKYGLPDGNRFVAFDIYREGRFLNAEEARCLANNRGIRWVPVLGRGEEGLAEDYVDLPYDFELLMGMAEGPTLIEGAKPRTIREGVVVRPLEERWHHSCGRVQLKIHSPAFLAL